MVAVWHQPAVLLYYAWFAKREEGKALVNGDFLFKFVAAQASIARRALDGEIGLFVAQTNADGAALLARDIPLNNMRARGGLLLEGTFD